jgi:hypothetical protein
VSASSNLKLRHQNEGNARSAISTIQPISAQSLQMQVKKKKRDADTNAIRQRLIQSPIVFVSSKDNKCDRNWAFVTYNQVAFAGKYDAKCEEKELSTNKSQMRRLGCARIGGTHGIARFCRKRTAWNGALLMVLH